MSHKTLLKRSPHCGRRFAAREHHIAARNMSLDAREAEIGADRGRVALRERTGSPGIDNTPRLRIWLFLR